jgi:hypothetical protein
MITVTWPLIALIGIGIIGMILIPKEKLEWLSSFLKIIKKK